MGSTLEESLDGLSRGPDQGLTHYGVLLSIVLEQGTSHLTLEREVGGLMISTGSNGEGPGGRCTPTYPVETPASVLPWHKRSISSKLIPSVSDGWTASGLPDASKQWLGLRGRGPDVRPSYSHESRRLPSYSHQEQGQVGSCSQEQEPSGHLLSGFRGQRARNH